MTTKSELLALADRVEELDGHCAEIEAEIAEALLPDRSVPICFTASIDAAMGLVGVDNKWLLTFVSEMVNGSFRAQFVGDAEGAVFNSHAKTPALAVTAAALRAIAEET